MKGKKLWIIIFTGIIASLALVQAIKAGTPIDGGNSFSSATPVQPDVEYTGVVSSTDAYDYYSFTVPLGHIVTVYYTATSDAYAQFKLYDQNQTELYSDWATSSGSGQVMYVGNNTTPSKYYFVVEYSWDTMQYDFLVKVSEQTDAGAIRDAGDSLNTATVITPSISTPVEGGNNRIGGADSDDYYKVNVLPGQIITVTVEPKEWIGSSNMYLCVELLDQAANKLDSGSVSAPSLNPIQLWWMSNQATPSSYYIHIKECYGFASGPNKSIAYKLKAEISRQNDAGMGSDAGDDYGTATLITPTLGTTWIYTDNLLGCSDTDDFYQINAIPGQIITATVVPVQYNGSYLELKAFLYDQNRNKLAEDHRSQPSVEPMVLFWMSDDTTPSAYLLRINDHSFSSQARSYHYKIEVLLDQQADGGTAGDAGDSFDSARAVTPFLEWDYNLLGGDDVKDCFLISSEKPYVGFSITPVKWPSGYAGSSLTIKFYDINGNLIDGGYLNKPSLDSLSKLLPTSRGGLPEISGYYACIESGDRGSYSLQYKIRVAVFNLYLPLTLRNY